LRGAPRTSANWSAEFGKIWCRKLWSLMMINRRINAKQDVVLAATWRAQLTTWVSHHHQRLRACLPVYHLPTDRNHLRHTNTSSQLRLRNLKYIRHVTHVLEMGIRWGHGPTYSEEQDLSSTWQDLPTWPPAPRQLPADAGTQHSHAGPRHRAIDRQTDKLTDRQTYKQTDWLTEWQQYHSHYELMLKLSIVVLDLDTEP